MPKYLNAVVLQLFFLMKTKIKGRTVVNISGGSHRAQFFLSRLLFSFSFPTPFTWVLFLEEKKIKLRTLCIRELNIKWNWRLDKSSLSAWIYLFEWCLLDLSPGFVVWISRIYILKPILKYKKKSKSVFGKLPHLEAVLNRLSVINRLCCTSCESSDWCSFPKNHFVIEPGKIA